MNQHFLNVDRLVQRPHHKQIQRVRLRSVPAGAKRQNLSALSLSNFLFSYLNMNIFHSFN